MRLLGPVPVELAAPDRAARDLLARFAADPGALDEATGAAPGLYLLVDDDDALRGFWVTVSSAWLEEGVVGGRVPPFVRGVLDAAVEEVWWARLRVAPFVLGNWRPLVVLEWLPFLAERAALPPPGVPYSASEPVEEPPVTEGGAWIEPDEIAVEDREEAYPATRDARWTDLPGPRSLLTLVRGTMRQQRGVHDGRFELVRLSGLEEGLGVGSAPPSWRRGIPLDEWVPEAAGGQHDPLEEHALGHPLRLPGDRVGFPLSGWLGRDLDLQPGRPDEAIAGVLVPRDTRNRLLSQFFLSTAVTALLLFGSLGFSQLQYRLAQPVLETEVATAAPEPQPAISVCSADHRRFMEAFRCQIHELAAGTPPDEVRCEGGVGSGLDLQATWCGLRDRDLDGDVAPSTGDAWADTAAAQACFEVLGRPHEYARADSGRRRAEPHRLLADSRLLVHALREVVDELDARCEVARDQLEARVAGAILGTHVSGGTDEADALQDLVFEEATSGASRQVRACYQAGRAAGPLGATRYDEVCRDEPASAVEPEGPRTAWSELAGQVPPDAPGVVERYVAARFRGNPPDARLWACHAALSTGARAGGARGRWEIPVRTPVRYGDPGVGAQIQLDAWLLALRNGEAAPDVCWDFVEHELRSYTPVHPLLPTLASSGWPGEEQQVCGRVCAARYRLGRASDHWVTPGTDLALCVDDGPPPEPSQAPSYGRDRLDALRVPWSRDRRGAWVPPSPDQICAFNLVAQGLLPGVLREDDAPPLWAGELAEGVAIAGGPGGAVARGAEALDHFGRSRSSQTCGDVAVACYASELLAVMADVRLGPHDWRTAWRRRASALHVVDREGLQSRPWCRVIRPYLREDGLLPEGELDFPCALGIDDARVRVEEAVGRIAAGALREVTR